MYTIVEIHIIWVVYDDSVDLGLGGKTVLELETKVI